MSLAGLLGALERDAEARMAADRQAAAHEVAELHAESERRLSQRREAATRAATATLEEARARELALATRRVRSTVLESRERALDRVLQRIHALAAAPGADAAGNTGLLELASAALSYVEGESALVRATPELVLPLSQRLTSEPRPRVVADPTIPAGAIITTEDGRVTVDATLAGWLQSREPEIRMLIVRLLERSG